ncbi:MAG: hypothetical protein JOZ14_07880 [Acidobacteria bacterium]|nr:hypothetical protein [Acidobacteriota bacterium]
MKHQTFIYLLLVGSAALAFASDKDISAILELHQVERRGHLTGNAELIAGTLADQLTVVENGEVQVNSREDVGRSFSDYLKSVRYSAWEDVSPPSVHISTDRKTAWVVIRIQATYTDKDSTPAVQHQFVSSWIAIYQKGKGGWRMAAIASGCNPPCGLPREQNAHGLEAVEH